MGSQGGELVVHAHSRDWSLTTRQRQLVEAARLVFTLTVADFASR